MSAPRTDTPRPDAPRTGAAGPDTPDPTRLDATGLPWRAPLRTPTAPAWTPPLRTPPGPVRRLRTAASGVGASARAGIARTPAGPAVRAAVAAAVLALPLIPVLTPAPEPEPASPPVATAASVTGPSAPEATRAAAVATTGARAARPVAPPSGLVVPAIGLTAGAPEQLAVGPDGTLGAPADFGRIGWWAAGPRPGQAGPAVIVGHVDSVAGPAVFWRLRDIPVGAQIVVPRTDGKRTTFTVDRVATYPKDAFPAAEVYGGTANAQLRLITCGGSFDRAVRSYTDNVVVFASVH
ncbi:class F sortase [Pseudonocardia alni]|uniref:class F sortase n=1 Tax=Pseudonocardia alni TaxID=33907 RepID=UPI0033C45FC0